MKWEYKTEIRLKALLSHHITQGVLSDHYCHKIPIHALFIGSNMETAVKLMTSTGGVRHSLFTLDTSFDYFHFIPDSHAGEILLKILCSPTIGRQLTVLLLSDLETVNPSISMEHDAVRMGQPVLLAYDFDMLRISRFITALKLKRQTGHLICFDFQKEALLLYCGDAVTISTIDLAKFERRFFS